MKDFYSELTPYYHLIYEDWEASIANQGNFLNEIIQSEWGSSARSVLDVSCGTGTQSIALAERGYQVTASDLSPEIVARARKEAETRNLRITFSICDMRDAYNQHGGGFDVVLAAGNSIPHLLSDSDILMALQEMHKCLRPDGGCIITTRQYDLEERGEGIIKPFGVRVEGDKRYIIFQVWDFEGEQYDFSMYFVEENKYSGEIETHVMHSRYYAISPDHLLDLIQQAGFVETKRLDDQSTHPAILVGTKKS